LAKDSVNDSPPVSPGYISTGAGNASRNAVYISEVTDKEKPTFYWYDRAISGSVPVVIMAWSKKGANLKKKFNGGGDRREHQNAARAEGIHQEDDEGDVFIQPVLHRRGGNDDDEGWSDMRIVCVAPDHITPGSRTLEDGGNFAPTSGANGGSSRKRRGGVDDVATAITTVLSAMFGEEKLETGWLVRQLETVAAMATTTMMISSLSAWAAGWIVIIGSVFGATTLLWG